MVDSDARLIEPAPAMGETGPVEQAISFRFSVTWASVFDPFEAPKPDTAVAPAVVAPINERVRPLATDAFMEIPAKKSPSNANFQWEMVVPKMVRSAPKSARQSEIATPANRSRPVLHPRPEPQPPVAPSNVAEQPIPNFCSASQSFPSRVRQSLSIKLLFAVTILAGLAVPVWRHFGSRSEAATEIQTTTRAGGWAREAVSRVDAGFNRARELVVYRPSLKATDGRFEFNWVVDGVGVGWVFRAKDTANYYAMRIKVLKPGPSPTLSVEHFTIYGGIEGGHAEKVLVLSRNDPVLRIRTDIAGPSFTLYIGETAVEYWNDTKLTAGGLGFFEEWHQGSDVQAIRMSFAPGTEMQRDGLRLYTNVPSGGD